MGKDMMYGSFLFLKDLYLSFHHHWYDDSGDLWDSNRIESDTCGRLAAATFATILILASSFLH